MEGAVHHIRFLIFDWSVPNIIMGAIIIAIFFLAAWARLPKWIERGRERHAATSTAKRRGK
jgi:protein-S-isoprenylcysteine O-methyltransferase Ste14